MTYGLHVFNQIKTRYSESWRQELSNSMCMGPFREKGEWVDVSEGVGLF